MKKEKYMLSFDCPNEKTYDQWKTENSMAIARVHMVVEDKLINWVEEEQPNTEGTQVAPQAVVLERTEEQGTVGLVAKQETKQEIQEESTKGKSEDDLEVLEEREKDDMS